jgi:hypothetical protein
MCERRGAPLAHDLRSTFNYFMGSADTSSAGAGLSRAVARSSGSRRVAGLACTHSGAGHRRAVAGRRIRRRRRRSEQPEHRLVAVGQLARQLSNGRGLLHEESCLRGPARPE